MLVQLYPLLNALRLQFYLMCNTYSDYCLYLIPSTLIKNVVPNLWFLTRCSIPLEWSYYANPWKIFGHRERTTGLRRPNPSYTRAVFPLFAILRSYPLDRTPRYSSIALIHPRIPKTPPSLALSLLPSPFPLLQQLAARAPPPPSQRK